MQPRCRTRVPVGYPAQIQTDTGEAAGMLLDLSPTGCMVRSDIELNEGAYLSLQIAVTQQPTPLAVEVSVVRWIKDGYFGVEFLRYSQGDRERVTDLVEARPSVQETVYSEQSPLALSAVGS
ncbi:MAG: PilZ domain-containing protein [Nitrospiraceae bacterium]|nr:PilZ domain-containing protein [Nitrospiraceae bacterium]